VRRPEAQLPAGYDARRKLVLRRLQVHRPVQLHAGHEGHLDLVRERAATRTAQQVQLHAKLNHVRQVAVKVRHRRRQLDEHRQDLVTQGARTHAKLHRLRQVAVKVRHRRRQLDEHRQDLVSRS